MSEFDAIGKVADGRPCVVFLARREAQPAPLFSSALPIDGDSIIAHTVDAALNSLRGSKPLLVVADLSWWQDTGNEVLSLIRLFGSTCVIIVAGRFEDVYWRVDVLRAGADMCLDTSDPPDVVMAEIRAVIRMTKAIRGVLVLDRLVLDPATRRVMHDARSVWLSPKQFDLLHLLMRRVNETVSLREIAFDVWGHPDVRCVDAYKQTMRSLRKRIERPGQPRMIHTIRGEGYRLAIERAGSPFTSINRTAPRLVPRASADRIPTPTG